MSRSALSVLALGFTFLAAPSEAEEKHAAHLCNETGTVKYSARWADGKVTLTARGDHRTGGWEVGFEQSKLKIFPPQFSLTHKRPEGFVTQAITPFNVSTTFKAAEKPKAVTVHDAKGSREIAVK